MKKMLILASILALTCSVSFAEENAAQAVQTTVKLKSEKPCMKQHAKPQMNPEFIKKKENFDKKLKLTDEQKAKAKELRKESFEKMKPIMEQIKTKHQEIGKIKKSDIAEDAKREQIHAIAKELRPLEKQAGEIRRQNMKDFEALLSKKQLKELNKIKKEGRKEFEKNHKPQYHLKHKNGFEMKGKPFEHGPIIPPPPKPPVEEK